LKQLAEFCGNERKAAVCRELSKIHEEVNLANLEDLIVYYSKQTKVKGEIVVVVAGNTD
jgi:16S rRNA (cytidine1402-2'-O)-methyltransferase